MQDAATYVPLSLMSRYFGKEVNVILKDSTSYHRNLIGIMSCQIMLTGTDWIHQDKIRSFGTRDEGIICEIWE